MTITYQHARSDFLLSVDEARRALILSAVRCLEEAGCGVEGMAAVLWGLPGGACWTSVEELLAIEHRRVLEQISRCGHGWIITDEIEGIIAAVGIAEGTVHNVEAVRAQVDEGSSQPDMSAAEQPTSSIAEARASSATTARAAFAARTR